MQTTLCPTTDSLPSPAPADVLPTWLVKRLEFPDLFESHKLLVFYEVSGRHGVIAQGPLTYEPSDPDGHFRHGGWPPA
jgi:hypothetical protein